MKTCLLHEWNPLLLLTVPVHGYKSRAADTLAIITWKVSNFLLKCAAANAGKRRLLLICILLVQIKQEISVSI
jgi:hypothetical protein